MYAAIRKHGCPEVLVSDSGSVFLDHKARQIYKALGIEKKEIEKRQSWQNYIETCLYVMWNLENSLHNGQYLVSTLIVPSTTFTTKLPPVRAHPVYHPASRPSPAGAPLRFAALTRGGA
jgi:transposase InsO family protein